MLSAPVRHGHLGTFLMGKRAQSPRTLSQTARQSVCPGLGQGGPWVGRVLLQLRAPRARSCPQPPRAPKRAGDSRRVAVAGILRADGSPSAPGRCTWQCRRRRSGLGPVTSPFLGLCSCSLGAGTGQDPQSAACGRSLGGVATGEPFFFK